MSLFGHKKIYTLISVFLLFAILFFPVTSGGGGSGLVPKWFSPGSYANYTIGGSMQIVKFNNKYIVGLVGSKSYLNFKILAVNGTHALINYKVYLRIFTNYNISLIFDKNIRVNIINRTVTGGGRINFWIIPPVDLYPSNYAPAYIQNNSKSFYVVKNWVNGTGFKGICVPSKITYKGPIGVFKNIYYILTLGRKEFNSTFDYTWANKLKIFDNLSAYQPVYMAYAPYKWILLWGSYIDDILVNEFGIFVPLSLTLNNTNIFSESNSPNILPYIYLIGIGIFVVVTALWIRTNYLKRKS